MSKLLAEVLGEEDIQQINIKASKKKVQLRNEIGQIGEAFSALCNGLVELSSMPKYQQEEEYEEDVGRQSENEGGLPMWLLGLVACCKLEEGSEASIRIQVHTSISFKSIIFSFFSSLQSTHYWSWLHCYSQ